MTDHAATASSLPAHNICDTLHSCVGCARAHARASTHHCTHTYTGISITRSQRSHANTPPCLSLRHRPACPHSSVCTTGRGYRESDSAVPRSCVSFGIDLAPLIATNCYKVHCRHGEIHGDSRSGGEHSSSLYGGRRGEVIGPLFLRRPAQLLTRGREGSFS